eukprot:350388-Chlamydomonas_euryale.AAC.27
MTQHESLHAQHNMRAFMHDTTCVPARMTRAPGACADHSSAAFRPPHVPPQDALLCGFDFVVAPVVRPGYRPPAPAPSAGGQLTPPFQRSDVLYLSSTALSGQVAWAGLKAVPWQGRCAAGIHRNSARHAYWLLLHSIRDRQPVQRMCAWQSTQCWVVPPELAARALHVRSSDARQPVHNLAAQTALGSSRSACRGQCNAGAVYTMDSELLGVHVQHVRHPHRVGRQASTHDRAQRAASAASPPQQGAGGMGRVGRRAKAGGRRNVAGVPA